MTSDEHHGRVTVLGDGVSFTPWDVERRRRFVEAGGMAAEDRVEVYQRAVLAALNAGIIAPLPPIPDDFTPYEHERVIDWLTARGTEGFQEKRMFVPIGGGPAREMWAAEMSAEGYAALRQDDRAWCERQWRQAGAPRPDIGERVLA